MLATLTELLNLLDLTEIGNDVFEGSQPDPPNHHIVGGQIAAQALLAASKTVVGRRPHSLHVYFLRLGDARHLVHFYVSRLRDGGTFSARRVTAAQDGEVLMETIASFTGDVDNVEYHDEVLNSCVLTYLTALTLLECAMTAMRKASMGTGVSALLDHVVWFHRRADFSDWLFYDQHSPGGVGGRALATGSVYNRDGALVCRATQEGYFGKRLSTG
jgi:acyl-CoA thioesterase